MNRENKISEKTKHSSSQYAHLLRVFVTASIIAMIGILLLTSFGIYMIYNHHIILDAEDESINLGHMLFEQEKDALLSTDSGGIIRVFVSEENFSSLDQRMKKYLKPMKMVKIKIFSLDRKIVYSTDHTIIGKIDIGNEKLERALKGKTVSKLEAKENVWDLDGEEKIDLDLVETYSPIKDKNGNIIGSFEVYVDVTRDRREIKGVVLSSLAVVFFVLLFAFGFLIMLMRSMAKELEITYQELEKKNKELQKLDRLKSQFVANVSHELKNPLNMIGLSLGSVIDEMADKMSVRQKNVFEIGTKNIERLIRLVTNLLDIANIESGKMKLKKEKADIALMINEILTIFEAQLSGKQVSLKKNISQDIGTALVDKDRFPEVIINLLNNAIKYTPTGGNITINLRGTEKEICLEILDTGPGIPEEYFDTIFDKFERIMTEKEEGTGLGLPIVKDIVKLHNGKVWVESELGKGSKFIVTLPKC